MKLNRAADSSVVHMQIVPLGLIVIPVGVLKVLGSRRTDISPPQTLTSP